MNALQLPARKSSKNTTVTFAPETENADWSPVAGVATITTDRNACRYRVEEFPTGDSARGFCLFKLDAGTDKTVEYHTVRFHAYVSGCSCKGFERFFHCKHTDAVRELVEAGQL